MKCLIPVFRGTDISSKAAQGMGTEGWRVKCCSDCRMVGHYLSSGQGNCHCFRYSLLWCWGNCSCSGLQSGDNLNLLHRMFIWQICDPQQGRLVLLRWLLLLGGRGCQSQHRAICLQGFTFSWMCWAIPDNLEAPLPGSGARYYIG